MTDVLITLMAGLFGFGIGLQIGRLIFRWIFR